MGQSLSEPKTEKETATFENEHFVVGCSSMQGWRTQMEDAHCVELSFDGNRSSAYFGVFDGHGSQNFAQYCSEELHKLLAEDVDYHEGNYRTALKSSFLTLDQRLQDDVSLNFQYEPGGTTALATLVKNSTIYCANAGDSRGIASVQGKVQELSHDHKPIHPAEESRIYKAGGWIEFNRVNGNLALSRAIGDFNFKSNQDLPQEEQIITANPEVIAADISPEHEFMVLACDGIWDVMSNQEVVDFVRKRIAQRMYPPQICEALLDNCLAPDCRMGGLGCDNMTVVIVCFLHGDSYSELIRRCCQESLGTRDSRLSSPDRAHSNGQVLYNEENVYPEKEVLFNRIPSGAGGISKLNDTLSSANTDLDFEIESSSPKKLYGDLEGMMNGVTISYSGEGVEFIEEERKVEGETLVHSDPEIEPFPAIETTV